MNLDPALMAHIPMAPPTPLPAHGAAERGHAAAGEEDRKRKAGAKRDGEGEEGEEQYARGPDEGQAGQIVGVPTAPALPVQNPPVRTGRGRGKGIRKVRAPTIKRWVPCCRRLRSWHMYSSAPQVSHHAAAGLCF